MNRSDKPSVRWDLLVQRPPLGPAPQRLVLDLEELDGEQAARARLVRHLPSEQHRLVRQAGHVRARGRVHCVQRDVRAGGPPSAVLRAFSPVVAGVFPTTAAASTCRMK